MAEIKFFANVKADDSVTEINHSAGSGLGFYGTSFGIAVPVNGQQSTTYVTNSTGTNQGTQLHNTAMWSSGDALTVGEVKLNNTNILNLKNLANFHCPLNIRFIHDEPVAVQNCKLRIFDRNSIDNAASGVTTWIFEARHPATTEVGDYSLSYRAQPADQFTWTDFDALSPAQELSLTFSPGVSGTNTNSQETGPSGTYGWITNQGSAHVSTRHDWYVAISSEPESIGSKTQYGLYFTAEYL